MRKLIFLSILLLIAAIPIRPQEQPRVKANWKLVTSAKSYHFFIDKSLIKETDKGSLVAFQMRIVRSDTREGQLAKKEDYTSISKLIGIIKAKKVAREISLIEVNCEEHKLRDLRVWLEDEKGSTLYDFPTESLKKWASHTGDSQGGRIIKAVCTASSD